MTTLQNDFPSVTTLRQGAILRTIAHALFMARDALMQNEVSWDGDNYNRQNTQGARGTITFSPIGTIGVFQDENAERNPHRAEQPTYSIDPYLIGMPDRLRDVADTEALQYMSDEHNRLVGPVITAAFWGEDDTLNAVEPWQDVLANGAHLVRVEAMAIEGALLELAHEYEFLPEQNTLLRALYERRLVGPTRLTSSEYAVLNDDGNGGVQRSCALLAAVKISVP